MKRITPALLRKFVDLASRRLTGDWLIMGGTVLPLLGVDQRVTVDIDCVAGAGGATQDQMLKLMEIAVELGLPVETINSAGAHFLGKIAGHRSHWIELKKGPKATLYRPDLILFLQLKTARMSESDLEDCLAFLKWDQAQDLKQARQLVQRAAKASGLSSERKDRFRRLLAAVSQSKT